MSTLNSTNLNQPQPTSTNPNQPQLDTRRYKALEMSLKLKKTWYQVMMVSKSRTAHAQPVGFRKFQVVYIDVAGFHCPQ
jgi:hypothetical protein